jgi:hypothetical protein
MMCRSRLASAIAVSCILLALPGCETAPEAGPTTRPADRAGETAIPSYPAAPGFNAEASDPEAIAIADLTMHAMGGYDAWQRTRYLAWNFFGARKHVWDRFTGDVRIEGTDRESGEPYVILMNIHSREGRAWSAGEPVTDPDRLASMLEFGRRAWINDSYWLIMPYKLKDTGVTLRYLGEASLADGRAADKLQLTFDDVGVTPDNMYHVYIAKDSGLVEQWEYFAEADDPEPRLSTPWRDWREYGGILLSGDRGERQITDIAVYDDLPRTVFEEPGEPRLPE